MRERRPCSSVYGKPGVMDAISDTLLLLSHPPTISLGRRATAADILAEPAALCRAGVSVWNSRQVRLNMPS